MNGYGLGSARRTALNYMLLCVVCWALIPNFAVQLRSTALEPAHYLFWSNLVSAGVLLAATRAAGFSSAFRGYRARDVLAVAGLGFLGAFGYYALLYTAYDEVSESSAPSLIIVQYTWPALTALLATVVAKERFSPRAAIGAGLGAVAVACGFFGADVAAERQLLIVGIAALTFAAYGVLSRTRPFEPYSYMTLLFAFGALFAALWLSQAATWRLPHTWQEWRIVLVNGAVANGLSYVWYHRALRLAPASVVAPWASVTPLLGATIYWLFGGTLGDGHWVGVLLVLASVWCTVERRTQPRTGTPTAPAASSGTATPALTSPDALAVATPAGRYRYH